MIKLSREEKKDFRENYNVDVKELSLMYENDFVKLFNDVKYIYVVDKKERMIVDCFIKESIEDVMKRYNNFKSWNNDIILK